ncbi:MAG TPA: SLC13 family permease [Acidimicrobiia bacterium]|nr:SLC13 family permease [Acidimicrobiia bacterium]
MAWEAWLVLAVVVGILAVLITDKASPALAMSAGMVIVLVAGIVTPTEALSGFSNPAPLTVAALFILARAVEKTGALTPIVQATLGETQGHRRSLARLVIPTTTASAFLNNTPIVSMLLPQVRSWAEGRGRPVSYYLMPLSYAALLGGVVTLIGTSTNLVIAGLLIGEGEPPLGFFEITVVGLPIAALGALLLVLLAPVLLPNRQPATHPVADEATRGFVVDMVVEPGGPLGGKTVEAAGLRHLSGLFLATLERDQDLLAPVAPDTLLRGGDRLRFVGKADQILDLQQTRGLRSAEEGHLVDFNGDGARYFEAVIGAESPLVGNTLFEAGFRSRYQAAVLAIHRAGQRVEGKLGQIALRVGDTLLLVADSGFRDRWRDRNDFLLVSALRPTATLPSKRAWIVGFITLGLVISASANLLPILNASLLAAVGLVAFRILTPSEARAAVELDVIVVIASAFGVAAAVEASGLASALAGGLVDLFAGFGDRGILVGVVLATVILTAVVSNNAAALLMFPIAIAAASATGVQARGFAIAVAVAASVDFLTPIGYQTNTMVYGPGGYRFGDYARLGAPLTVLVVAVLAILVPTFWPAPGL